MKEFGPDKIRKPKNKQKQSQHHTNPADGTDYSGTIILVCTLVVAAITITIRVFEPVVWAFLSAIAGYAAAISKPNHREEGGSK